MVEPQAIFAEPRRTVRISVGFAPIIGGEPPELPLSLKGEGRRRTEQHSVSRKRNPLIGARRPVRTARLPVFAGKHGFRRTPSGRREPPCPNRTEDTTL